MLNAKWVKEHASHRSEDYVVLLEQYGKPILAVTGTADISTDYRRLSALQNIPLAESYTPHNVNHILPEIDDDNSVMTVKKQYGRLRSFWVCVRQPKDTYDVLNAESIVFAE